MRKALPSEDTVIDFKISSFCSFGSCVEVGRSPDGGVRMRDATKQALTFNCEEWGAFIAKVKAGDYDLPMIRSLADTASGRFVL